MCQKFIKCGNDYFKLLISLAIGADWFESAQRMALDCMIKYGFPFLIRQGHLFYGKSFASVYFFKALVEIWNRFHSDDLSFCTMSVHVLQQLPFIGADIYTHGINW